MTPSQTPPLPETLSDALRDAAPDQELIIDGDVRLDAETLRERATALARTLLTRFPQRGVVSLMLPNWHEAAVVYLGATLAGMAVNPILPSLRDHELRFILDDVDSRIIFVPSEFRGHDYAGMLDRVVAVLPVASRPGIEKGPRRAPRGVDEKNRVAALRLAAAWP